MRMIALLFAIVVSGCTGDRLKAEMRPNAVALRAPPVSEQALHTVSYHPRPDAPKRKA
jgi:hypothetical protein